MSLRRRWPAAGLPCRHIRALNGEDRFGFCHAWSTTQGIRGSARTARFAHSHGEASQRTTALAQQVAAA